MPQRKCDEPTCRKTYFYQSGRSEYCSTKCRTRTLRARQEAAANPLFVPNDDPDTDPVCILQARAQAKRDGDDSALAAAMAQWNALPNGVTDPKGTRW